MTIFYEIPNDFGASCSVGLTIGKLLEAQDAFLDKGINIFETEIVLSVHSCQYGDLVNQICDGKGVYGQQGRLTHVLGFRVELSPELPMDDQGNRVVVAQAHLTNDGWYEVIILCAE